MDVKGKHDFEQRPEVNGTPVLTEGAAEISALTEKVTPVSADLLLIEDSAASNAKKKLQIGNIASIFGSEYQTARSDGQSSTTSTTPVQKLRMTTTSLVGGNYYIGWFFEWGADADDKNNQFRVQIDDTTTLTSLCFEDRGKATDTPAVWRLGAGWDIRTLSSGVKNIDIDYWTDANTVYIRNARLVLWRVS